jgi:hypothetical protein
MKKINRLLILSIIIILCTFHAHSQVLVDDTEAMLDKMRLNKSINGIEDVSYSSIVGDPYIFKDFHQGIITLTNGETYQLSLRYDIYGNQIHIKEKDQIYAIVHPEKVASIIIDTLRFIYCNYRRSPVEETSGEDSYFILKTDGKCKLLIKKNIRIQDAELPKLYQDAKPAKFIHTGDTYYLKPENKTAVRIDNKKDLLSILADKKDELASFIISNKLGVKEVDDLVKIISFYNHQ